MKTQRIKKVTVLVVVLLMIGGVNLQAQNRRSYSEQDKTQKQYGMCQILPDLTEDQETKISALKLSHLKEMNASKNQINELRAKKRTLITADSPDTKAINALIDNITEEQNKVMKANTKHRLDVRNLLTDDQKVYFDSMPMRGHGHGRRGRHFGNHGYRNDRGMNHDCQYGVRNN